MQCGRTASNMESVCGICKQRLRLQAESNSQWLPVEFNQMSNSFGRQKQCIGSSWSIPTWGSANGSKSVFFHYSRKQCIAFELWDYATPWVDPLFMTLVCWAFTASQPSLGQLVRNMNQSHTSDWTITRLQKGLVLPAQKTATVSLNTATLNSLRATPSQHRVQVIMPSFVSNDKAAGTLGTVNEQLDASMKMSGEFLIFQTISHLKAADRSLWVGCEKIWCYLYIDKSRQSCCVSHTSICCNLSLSTLVALTSHSEDMAMLLLKFLQGSHLANILKAHLLWHLKIGAQAMSVRIKAFGYI